MPPAPAQSLAAFCVVMGMAVRLRKGETFLWIPKERKGGGIVQQKPVTIKDIANHLGVSLSTVNKALTGKSGISEARRQEIISTAQQMGYQVNHVARSLARRPICFGVVFPRFWESFWHEVRQGMDEELSQLTSYHVSCEMRYVDSEEETGRAVRELLDRKVDALILFMAGFPFDEALCAKINESGIPVFVSGDEERQLNAKCTIGVNGELAGSLAADVLQLMLRPGDKTAVFIGSSRITIHTRKAEAFRQAMEKNGFPVVCIRETQDDEQQAAACTAQLLQEHPDLKAIYVASATGGPVIEHCARLQPEQRPVIVATDVYDKVRTAMEDGVVTAVIHQNQELMGRLTIRVAYAYLCGQNSYCMERQETVERIDVNPRLLLRSGIGEDAISAYRV